MPIQPQGAAKQREAPQGRSAVCMAKQREIRLAYMSLFLYCAVGLNAHSAADSCAAAGSPVGALCGLCGEAEIEDRGGKQI
ncbi:MAG: hypothetical protein U0M33_05730 [Lachnospiraceae bacterium]|nr:hypothetical protein [Lachnospiraceae bacterium]